MTAVVGRRTSWAGFPGRGVELAAWGAILILAGVLRLGDLAVRGTWDADQGHDMLVLRALVLDGQLPLLGPPTSIGDFHHGVLYYLLLTPAAALSHADPVAVTTFIALCGIAAVAVTAWLARSIAGPTAGLIAALLLAVSSSAVEESIFIWNPNLIALSSSIALAAAWRAWTTGRARWWLAAGAAAVVTMHCHVLGTILTPVIGGLLAADIMRRLRRGDGRGAGMVGRAALGWLGLALLSYVPLAIHELGSDASELRAAVAFVVDGGPASIALPARLPIVGLRVLGWPLAGLITTAPLATILAAALVVGLAVWRGWLWRGEPNADESVATGDPRTGADLERAAVRWLALGLTWTVVALAAGASSLASVVIGLPNDHYHAFADPMVVVLVAVGLANLLRLRPARSGASLTVAAIAVILALAGWNLTHQPPARAADGGWAAARSAAARIAVATAGDGPIVVASLPTFKSDEAIRMPLAFEGVALLRPGVTEASIDDPVAPRVVLCDQLFRASIGTDCGGPAEDVWIMSSASGLLVSGPRHLADLPTLVDRFEAAPGRWISVYLKQP